TGSVTRLKLSHPQPLPVNRASQRHLTLRQAIQISPNDSRARILRPESAQIGSVRVPRQIARLLQLPQILQHQRQIRLPDGDGGVSGLERLLRRGQRLPQQIASLLQLPQILQHQRQIRLPDGDGGVSGLERLLRRGQRCQKQTPSIRELPQLLQTHRQPTRTESEGGRRGLERLLRRGQG